MKNIFSLFIIAASFMMFSCSTETDIPVEGTAVQDMAGIWDVTIDALTEDADGNLVSNGDIYGIGEFQIYTYNTNRNASDAFIINDMENFWNFTFECPVNYSSKTFACVDVPYYSGASSDETATITNGKVLLGAAKNLHGMPNDSIVFDIKFSDETEPDIVAYRISGQRYTGFYE